MPHGQGRPQGGFPRASEPEQLPETTEPTTRRPDVPPVRHGYAPTPDQPGHRSGGNFAARVWPETNPRNPRNPPNPPTGRRLCPQFGTDVPPASPVCAPRPDRPRDNSARHRPEITPSNPPNPPRGELTSCPKSAFRRPPRPLRPTSACVERAHMQHSFVHGRLSMTIEACTHPPTSNTQKTPLPLSCALCAIACYAWLT